MYYLDDFDIFNHLVGTKWLTFTDVVRLDSAFVENDNRRGFLLRLESSPFFMNIYFPDTKCSEARKWLFVRNLLSQVC